MTTYELPPEPPGGAGVKDRNGNLWTSTNVGWLGHAEDGRRIWETWNGLLARLGPLTLIEPDPWPTAPLIAAEGRLWFRQEDGDYLDKDGTVRGEGRHTFAGPVVPVTVVPTAEWDAMREAMRAWEDGAFSPVTSTIRALLSATDALGLDQ